MKTKCGPIGDLGSFPRAAAMAASAFAAIMVSAAPAHAICAPASGDNVTATCTGTTNNQDSYAGIIAGYGQKNQINLNTTVVQGATVTGTHNGINFYTGSVTNAGAVTGTLYSGIFVKTPAGTGAITVNNSGSITGGNYGINTFTDVAVTNSGTITGTAISGIESFNGGVTLTNAITGTVSGAIYAGTSATVTNSGSITGGINADSVTVTNILRGTISGGISANTDVTVTNAGTIDGAGNNGIYANNGTATVSNSGTIMAVGAGSYAIYANIDARVTNSGVMTGDAAGIYASSGAATVTNSGTITATGKGSYAVYANTTANVVNSGVMTGDAAGIYANTGAATVSNSGTITATGASGRAVYANTDATVINSGLMTGGAAGIYASSGAATVTNSGTITVAGARSYAVFANTTANVVNSGVMTGDAAGIFANNGAATVTNSGTITAAGAGSHAVFANTTANVVNSGVMTGDAAGIYANNGAATVTNSGTITASGASGRAVYANTAASVVNSGLIAGGAAGIYANNDAATVTNFGTIVANGATGSAVYATTAANVVNSSTITATGGGGIGILAGTTGNVANSGLIAGDALGIKAGTSTSVTNSGTIAGTGAAGIGILAGTTGNVTNSGAIIGAGGTAIQFNANGTPGSDTLTILAGARFAGLVNFGGGADRVNFGPGNWVLNIANFNAALSIVTTPGTPYLVTPNQIVVADVSGFGAQNRAIMDITGWINSVLPDTPVFAPAAGARASSFAAADAAASPLDAVASFPPDALGYAATKAPVFNGGAAVYADGNAMWAKGFGGQRRQDTSGLFAGSITTGYGGAVGYERVLNPDLKLGGLVGASGNQTNLDRNAGGTNTDTVFGGAYGRFTQGGTFLDLAVIGGNLDNTSARNNIAGGLALQTATACYGGWFVDPAMALGHRIEIDQRGFTITPAVKARYVAAHFDGYTETGSTANLTIRGRDFQAWEERAEITFANTGMIGAVSVTARVTGGILGQQRTTGGQVNIALVGQNFLAATPDRGSVAGFYGSAGLDWQIGRATLFAAGEASYANDATRTYAGKGGVRVAW